MSKRLTFCDSQGMAAHAILYVCRLRFRDTTRVFPARRTVWLPLSASDAVVRMVNETSVRSRALASAAIARGGPPSSIASDGMTCNARIAGVVLSVSCLVYPPSNKSGYHRHGGSARPRQERPAAPRSDHFEVH